MAVSNITVDIASHDYGNKILGTTTDFVFTFTNVSSPSRSCAITLTGPSAPYSITVGGSSFTLANNGDTHATTVRFAPVTLGTFSDSITVTNSDSFNNPDPVTLTGVGFTNIYDLPNVANLPNGGTVKVRLIMPTSAPPLTVPTKQTIINIGEITESAEDQIGLAAASTCILMLADDYSTHTEGFWYKVFQYSPKIRLYLTEGGSDTFLFYGTPQSDLVEWTEHYIGSGVYVRTAEVTLISMEGILFSTPTSDWSTVVYANRTSLGLGAHVAGEMSAYTTILGLFSAMLSASNLNSSYDATDTSFVYDSSNLELKFFYSGGTLARVDQILFPVAYYVNGTPDDSETNYLYWQGAVAGSLGATHATLQDMISSLLANFGLAMRLTYDIAGDRHKIQLIQKGRAYSSTVTMVSGTLSGIIRKASTLVGDAAICRANIGTSLAWYSTKYSNTALTTTSPPNFVSFSFDKTLPWNKTVASSTIFTDISDYIIAPDGSAFTSVEFWSYSTSAYVSIATVANIMCPVIAGYAFNRFSNKYTEIERDYGSIQTNDGSTSSHTNSTILRRSSINVGDGAVVYKANKVVKMVSMNRMKIIWLKES